MKFFLIIFAFILSSVNASVNEFGYNPMGSGVQPEAGKLGKVSFANKTTVIGDKYVSKYMPLYLNKGEFPKVPEVLVFARRNEANDLNLVYFGLKSWKPIQDLFLGKGTLAAMPVYYPETQTVYVLTHSPEKRLLLRLYSHHLVTNTVHHTTIDLLKIYKKEYAEVNAARLEHLLGCKTALKVFNRKIVFGCSIPIEYGEHRGIRGIVLSVDIGKRAEFAEVNYFIPSLVTKNPYTGFNTGIYNAGGGLTFFPPDNLIVLTGNGPSFPREGNYGCAILRLDLNRLTVRDSLLFDDDNFHECFAYNQDFSTSSAAIAGSPGDHIGAAITSSGYLQLFDPLAIAESKKKLPSLYVGLDNSFGQASIIQQGPGKFQLIFTGNRKTSQDFWATYVVATAKEKEELVNKGYQQEKCLGQILPNPKGDFSLYYSGKYRGNYILLRDDTPIAKEIVAMKPGKIRWQEGSETKDFQSPYVKVATVVKAGEAAEYKQKKKVPLTAFLREGFYNLTDGIFAGNKPIQKDKNFEVGEMLKGCSEDVKLPQLFLYSRKVNKSNDERWNLLSFEYDSKTNKLTKQWEFVDEKKSVYPHSHIATTWSQNEKKGFVVVPVITQKGSDILIVDATTGKLLKRVAIPGEVHFSMPLITGDNIFIATLENGIQVLKLNH